jgi:putative colanic acid biosynthesis acetyltransferase WcaF
MLTSDLSRFNNSWYKPGAGIIKIFFWYVCNLFFIKNRYNPFSSVKILLLRLFGAKIGKEVKIKPAVNIKYPWNLEIGNNTWIGENVWIDNLEKVTIGSNVCISQGALLMCGNHNYKKSTFDLIIGNIAIEDGVWIGAKSIVCPGVICKSHSVLTAGSVATKDIEPYGIYQGNPAILIRQRDIVE